MDKSDLLAYAKEYATTRDLYELLGVTSDTPKEDIHRAWRKRSIKYHPDKAGAQFDAAKWELFERARDVLSDVAAREAYDGARSAALLREEQRRAMDAKRRAMVEDLEARERGAVKRPRGDREGPTMSDTERNQLAEAGRRRVQERQRLMREAEARESQREREREEELAKTNAKQQTEPLHPVRRPEAGEQERNRRKTPDDIPDSERNVDPESMPKDDGYDGQIADLERRLQEARRRKEARKEKKAAAKGSGGSGGGSKSETHQATSTPLTPNIPERPKADKKKGSPPSLAKSASVPATATSAHTSASTPMAGSRPRVKGDFSSTMARLRAAQADKEALKKAEVEEAATPMANSDAIAASTSS